MREKFGIKRMPPYAFEVIPLHDTSLDAPPCGCLFHVEKESLARAHVAEHNLLVGTPADPYYKLARNRVQPVPLTEREREIVDEVTILETWRNRKDERVFVMGRAFARRKIRRAA